MSNFKLHSGQMVWALDKFYRIDKICVESGAKQITLTVQQFDACSLDLLKEDNADLTEVVIDAIKDDLKRLFDAVDAAVDADCEECKQLEQERDEWREAACNALWILQGISQLNVEVIAQEITDLEKKYNHVG